MTFGYQDFDIDPRTENEVCLKVIAACGGEATPSELARMMRNAGWSRDYAARKLKLLAMRGALARVENVQTSEPFYQMQMADA